MRVARASLAVAAVALATGCGVLHHDNNAHIAPAADVEMDGEVLSKFGHEVEEYVELHQELLHRIPNVHAGATSEEIAAHRAKMAKGITEERKSARRGEIFKPKVEAAFRRVIEEALAADRDAVVQAVKDGNPRVEGVPDPSNPGREHRPPVRVAVNAIYPDDAPFSSVPPTLLQKLPQLPEEVKYRFVGRDLILRDTEANVILDFIPNAIPDRSIPR